MSSVKRSRRKSAKQAEASKPTVPEVVDMPAKSTEAAPSSMETDPASKPKPRSPATTPSRAAKAKASKSTPTKRLSLASASAPSPGKKASPSSSVDVPASNAPAPSGESTVLYVGHIPHGFYEKEMGLYFAQFGDILRLRICRAWKTGASRGFGFIEFASAAAASAAAEAMQTYLMHGRSLRTEVVPREKVHPETFKGANRRFSKQDWVAKRRKEMAKNSQDETKMKKRMKRIEKKHVMKKEVLKKLNVPFEAPDIVGKN